LIPLRILGGGLAVLFGGLVLLATTDHVNDPVDPDLQWSAEETAVILGLAIPDALPPSPSNRFADDDAAAALGQQLFFDTGFSADGSLGCVSCHKPSLYFTDGQPLAVGIGKLDRHTPTVIGAQWNSFQFWDGRKDTLWSQALAPFEGPLELGVTRLDVVRRVRTHYLDAYSEIFGDMKGLDNIEQWPEQAMPMPADPDHPWAVAWEALEASEQDAINGAFANIGKAIAAYERKLAPQPAPFDRYVEAIESGDLTGGGHLSDSAERGLKQFIGPAGCIHCHNGPMLSDQSFHAVGLEPVFAQEHADLGRAGVLDDLLADPFNSRGKYSDSEPTDELTYVNPEFDEYDGAFKTPTLRNVGATAPYGHNGQFRDLPEVIEWYRELPRVPLARHRDKILKVLPDEVVTEDLVAFLDSLTGALPDERWLTSLRDD
jgi:cytochrome c peroxidase